MNPRRILLAIQALLIAVVSHAAIKVACVGNSITEGLGMADPASESYPAQLARILGEGYEVRNFGKSRATLLSKGHFPYVKQKQFADALVFGADIALIHLGINDTDPRNWPNYGDEFIDNYVALVDSFKAVNQKVRVILATLTPITPAHKRFKSGTRDWRLKINNAIRKVALATDAELIDFGEELMHRRNFIPDAVHPDRHGAAILAGVAASAITGDYGGLQLPSVYADGMVLQRGKPLVIGGMADAGQKVTLTLGDAKASAIADNCGKWSATLPPQQAAEGLCLTIATPTRTLTFSDIAVGEVWLASGQSNMEFKLRQASTFDQDTVAAADCKVRLFDMPQIARTSGANKWSASVLDSVDNLAYFGPAHWSKATPEAAADFSAIGWNFGRMLADSLGVTVGIICNAVGGSGTEAWIDPETLDARLPDAELNWRTNDYVQPWVQRRAGENTGTDTSHRHPYEPTYLFSAGIRPLGAFPIAGVIWYQGESNAHNMELHEIYFPLLVQSWRANWSDRSLPFLTVQLSSMERPSWPAFRDSQRRLALGIEGVEMAVSSDVGNRTDVHPRDKRPVAHRLGLLALNKIYGHDVVCEGPVPAGVHRGAGGVLVIEMKNGEGLTEIPASFELAGADGIFHPAEAEVRGTSISVRSEAVAHPCLVRYGWQPYSQGNLRNAAGLPASTFCLAVEL